MVSVLKTRDFDELSAAQEGWEVHHRPVRTGGFEGRLITGCTGSIQVDLEQWDTALELTGTAPKQGLSFVLPLHASGSYLSEGHDVTADRIDVIGPGQKIHTLTKYHASLIACTISMEALEDRADSPVATQLMEYAAGHTVLQSTRQATDDLRRWWLELLALFARDSIPVEAQDRLLDETLLIIARPLGWDNKDRVTSARSRYLLARRARDYMLERQARPPAIAEICTYLHASERKLHYAFSRTFGVSPKRFLKTRRLFAAHQALKSAYPGERVHDIAMRQGFWDLGYFARDYKAMFDELPSTTLKRQNA